MTGGYGRPRSFTYYRRRRRQRLRKWWKDYRVRDRRPRVVVKHHYHRPGARAFACWASAVAAQILALEKKVRQRDRVIAGLRTKIERAEEKWKARLRARPFQRGINPLVIAGKNREIDGLKAVIEKLRAALETA